jgi:hypothetical protein
MIKIHCAKCDSNIQRYHDDFISDHRLNPDVSFTYYDCNCDGYHTFDELYQHRHALFIALCKKQIEIAKHAPMPDGTNFYNVVWRSKFHSDETTFDDWFLLGIGKEKGNQLTYHLPMSYWVTCSFAETLDKAPEFDGHTSDDVLTRLMML